MEFSVHVQAAVASSSSNNNNVSLIALLDDKHNNDTHSINNKEEILKESCQAFFGNCFNVMTTKLLNLTLSINVMKNIITL